jgi:hypothetical protein
MSQTIVFDTKTGSVQKELQYQPEWDIAMNLNYFDQVVDKKVLGWFFFFDHALIHAILKEVQKDLTGDVCEIGVAFGKSAIALSNYKRSDENLYLYDMFQASDLSLDVTYDNIKKYGTDKNIQWRVTDTTKLTEEDINFTCGIRLLHVDGCHEHEAVYGDLSKFSKNVLDDGIIVVDDYNDPEYPGINSGTWKFLFENKEWTIFAIGQNKAYICKTEKLNNMIMCLIDVMEDYRKLGIPFTPNLRGVNGHNVLMCCSREQVSYDQIRNNLTVPVPLK